VWLAWAVGEKLSVRGSQPAAVSRYGFYRLQRRSRESIAVHGVCQ